MAVPKRFDFIVVDVCYGLGAAENRRIQCPVKEFEEEKVIIALSKNLAPYGLKLKFISMS